jgi:hypothetical protein
MSHDTTVQLPQIALARQVWLPVPLAIVQDWDVEGVQL